MSKTKSLGNKIVEAIRKNKNVVVILIILVVLLLVSLVQSFNNSKLIENKNEDTTSIKYSEELESKSVPIAHGSSVIEDPNMEYGKEAIRSQGHDGLKIVTYNVKYKDGVELLRNVIKEEVKEQPKDEVIAKGTKILWHCIDATSYDRNPYNDNECTSSTGEVRYVSDSQSVNLDPNYSPGKAGHPYYNNQ